MPSKFNDIAVTITYLEVILTIFFGLSLGHLLYSITTQCKKVAKPKNNYIT